MTSNDGYAIVLKDLNDQRQALKAECVRLEKECAELDQLIAGITRRIPPDHGENVPVEQAPVRFGLYTQGEFM
ncbi:MAG: hypothetical protein WCD57_02895, partial [Acidobacteriaceae bacterium]